MYCYISLDLHVLGTPPAFILSQDQTLKIYLSFFLVYFFNFSVIDVVFVISSSTQFSKINRCLFALACDSFFILLHRQVLVNKKFHFFKLSFCLLLSCGQLLYIAITKRLNQELFSQIFVFFLYIFDKALSSLIEEKMKAESLHIYLYNKKRKTRISGLILISS